MAFGPPVVPDENRTLIESEGLQISASPPAVGSKKSRHAQSPGRKGRLRSSRAGNTKAGGAAAATRRTYSGNGLPPQSVTSCVKTATAEDNLRRRAISLGRKLPAIPIT